MVTAVVDHMSLWDVVIAEIDYGIQNLLGNRTDPPTCNGPLPDWVNDINAMDNINAPLLVCGETTPTGDLRLKVASNRGYSMTLTANVAITIEEEGATLDIGQTFAKTLTQAKAQLTYLPAGGTTELIMTQPTKLPASGIEVKGRVDLWSVTGDLASKALGTTDINASRFDGYLSCVVAAADSSMSLQGTDRPQDAVTGVSDAFLSCLDETVAFLGGAITAGLRNFLAAVDIWDISGTVAEAWTDANNDLAYFSVIPRVSAFRNTPAPGTAAPSVDPLPWDTTLSTEPLYSGCSPGITGGLPDGEWFGLVDDWDNEGVDFDLVCFYGVATVEESGNTFYYLSFTNDSDVIRHLYWGDHAIGFPLGPSGSNESGVPVANLVTSLPNPAGLFPALVVVVDSSVSEIVMVFPGS